MPEFNSGGLTFHYEDEGQGGTPLVLLHGLGSSARDWEHQIPAFAATRRVIAPDLRGFGRSAQPPGPYTPNTHAADVRALLQQLELEQVDMLGYSLGGAAALQFALDAPQRLRRLILLNSDADFTFRSIGRLAGFWLRKGLIRLAGPTLLAKVIAKKLFPYPDQASLRATLSERFSENTRTAYLAALNGLAGWSAVARLHEIDCPVLVIAAAHDYVSPTRQASYVARMPRAELEVIEGSRHGTPFDARDRLNALVLDFLDEAA